MHRFREPNTGPAGHGDPPVAAHVALAVNGMGSFCWDLRSGEMKYDDAGLAVLGFEPGEYDDRPATVADRMVPQELPGIQAQVGRALKARTGYSIYFRVRRPDGSLRWTHSQATVVCDDAGTPVRVVGGSSGTPARNSRRSTRRGNCGRPRASGGGRPTSWATSTTPSPPPSPSRTSPRPSPPPGWCSGWGRPASPSAWWTAGGWGWWAPTGCRARSSATSIWPGSAPRCRSPRRSAPGSRSSSPAARSSPGATPGWASTWAWCPAPPRRSTFR